MKKLLLAAALAVSATGTALAGPVVQDVWYEFGFDGAGSTFACPACTPATNPTAGTTTAFADAPAWTITLTSAATLTVLDLFLSVDSFEVFNNAVSLGLTSAPTSGGSAGSDISAALADAHYSRGFFALGAGNHSITMTSRGQSGAAAFLIQQQQQVPEPVSLALVAVALLGLGVTRRRA